MKTYRLKQAEEVFRSGQSTGHHVASAKQADVVLLNLAPGDKIPPHALEINVLFAVAEGSATLTSSGTSCMLSAGDTAEVAPGEMRAWENSGDTACRIFVVKQKA